MECLRDKQQSWCFRLDQEKRSANQSFFVTLTYDDDYLTYADDEPCLVKRDVQLFFKQLRKRLEPKTIKYYCVGEYGDQWRPITPKGRPHYHALIFYYGNIDRFKLSLLIKDIWYHGIAQVLPVLGAQGYVTKYIMKFDKREHLVKPFSLISHGLGIDYLSPQMVKYHRRNLQGFAIKPGGYKITLPRYYKDKIFGTWAKQVMKVRADLYRQKLAVKLADYEFFCMSAGANPFIKRIKNYYLKVYKSLNLYKEKRKL